MNRAVGARERGRRRGPTLPRVTRQRETANGAALNITALVFCPGKQGEATGAQLASTVSRSRSCMTTEPRSSRYFVGASGLVPWHRRASTMTILPDSPTLERSGMMASLRASGSNLRQQAAKPSAGVSVQFGLRSESGQFWECSALERSLRSGRLAERPKADRSHG